MVPPLTLQSLVTGRMVSLLHCLICSSWLMGGLPSSSLGVRGRPDESRKKANRLEEKPRACSSSC